MEGAQRLPYQQRGGFRVLFVSSHQDKPRGCGWRSGNPHFGGIPEGVPTGWVRLWMIVFGIVKGRLWSSFSCLIVKIVF